MLDLRNLRETIQQSQREITRWELEFHKHHADALLVDAKRQIAQRQATLERLAEQALADQMAACSVHDRDRMQEQIENARDNLHSLQTLLHEKQSHLEHLSQQQHQLQVEIKREQENARQIETIELSSLENLTQGVICFQYLGLDFIRGRGDGLRYVGSFPIYSVAWAIHQHSLTFPSFISLKTRFSFTQLDPTDPNRAFVFELAASGDDLAWELVEIEPAEAWNYQPDVLTSLMTALNRTDDLANFVKGMRRLFLDFITG
jgi:hypothetical protein